MEQKFTVLMSAVNEDEALKETVRIILETCSHQDLAEIFIFVGLNATASCLSALEEVKESSDDVPVNIFHQTYKGPGANWNEFFELFKGTHIVTVAADGELDPYQVSEFIERSKEKPEYIIIGSRKLGRNGFKDYYFFKKMLNMCAGAFLRVLYQTDRTEFTQPFFSGPVGVFSAIRWEEQFHPVFMEMILKPMRLGVKAEEIPTEWKKRQNGKPNRGAFYFLPYLKTAVRIRTMKKNRILKQGREIPEKYTADKKG